MGDEVQTGPAHELRIAMLQAISDAALAFEAKGYGVSITGDVGGAEINYKSRGDL